MPGKGRKAVAHKQGSLKQGRKGLAGTYIIPYENIPKQRANEPQEAMATDMRTTEIRGGNLAKY